MMNFKSILVLAPHTDDGELGAGGSIAKFVENGAEVTYVAFSIAEESVPAHLPRDILKKEVGLATSKLGINANNLIVLNYPVRKLNFHRQEILEELIKIRKERKFDLVLLPSLGDIHQDHHVVAEEGVRAFKNTTILAYELIWNNFQFNNACFIKLDKKHVQAKCDAMQEYESQAGRDYVSEEFIYSLAKTRGVQIGSGYAECFEVVRWVIN